MIALGLLLIIMGIIICAMAGSIQSYRASIAKLTEVSYEDFTDAELTREILEAARKAHISIYGVFKQYETVKSKTTGWMGPG